MSMFSRVLRYLLSANGTTGIEVERTANDNTVRIKTAGADRLIVASNGELRAVSNMRIDGALKDSSNAAGTAGYLLSTTGTGTAWVAAPIGVTDLDGLNDAQKNLITNNLFIGHNGFTGTYYNDSNTAIGIGALTTPNTDSSNASFGDGNVAIGYQALTSNTTGYRNSAQGYRALNSNTTGSSNSAQGMQAFYSNTTGSNNSAQGYQVLYLSTTGSNNSAQGYQAARFIADGSTALTIVNQGVFLGANTKALADNSTNEIVIGYNATGLGSNTAVLGNDSITKTVLKGNVVIGATVATSKLQVVGLPSYADNTTALAGGLTVGAFYRTAVGVLMVVF